MKHLRKIWRLALTCCMLDSEWGESQPSNLAHSLTFVDCEKKCWREVNYLMNSQPVFHVQYFVNPFVFNSLCSRFASSVSKTLQAHSSVRWTDPYASTQFRTTDGQKCECFFSRLSPPTTGSDRTNPREGVFYWRMGIRMSRDGNQRWPRPTRVP